MLNFFVPMFIAFLLGIAFYVPMVSMLKGIGLERSNYAGRRVATAGGIFVLMVTISVLGLLILLDILLGMGLKETMLSVQTILLLALLSAVSVIGLIDDLDVGGQDKGLGGHLRAFFEGRITTGFIKAAAGSILSLFVAYFFSDSLSVLVLNTLVLAVSINLFNILDLRPGRSAKIFLVALVLLFISGSPAPVWVLVGAFTGALLVFVIADLKELAMLGDSGANMLGAMFGYLLVASVSTPAKLILLVLMIALELIGDRYSLSKFIAANPVLNKFDMLGRRSGSA